MDILLGAGSGPLGKLLSGKNGALIMALLPVLLGLLGSAQTTKPSAKPTSKSKKPTKKTGLLGQSGSASGLESLVGALSSGGLGDIVGSWVGGGPNKAITPAQVKKGLGADAISDIAAQAGLSVGDTATGLSALLPVLVNHLTPQAAVPAPSVIDEALQGLSGLLPKL
jgi:uncharacterized protein YidB (DUF937 family)